MFRKRQRHAKKQLRNAWEVFVTQWKCGDLHLYCLFNYVLYVLISTLFNYLLYVIYREEAAALTSAIGSFISMIVVWYTVPKHVKHVKSEGQYLKSCPSRCK